MGSYDRFCPTITFGIAQPLMSTTTRHLLLWRPTYVKAEQIFRYSTVIVMKS